MIFMTFSFSKGTKKKRKDLKLFILF